MKKFIQKHKICWSGKKFCVSALSGLLLFITSLIINYAANIYAVEKESNPVTDILLNRLPVINTDFILLEGAGIFILVILLLLIYQPQRLPFVLKTVALFIIIRSIFISLTHIGPFPGAIIIETNKIYQTMSFGADLFFSGHTGLPYLFALMFWQRHYLRIFFLASSFIAAVSVILGHLHYTIDVVAAYFITYTIFVLAKKFFQTDYQLFLGEAEIENE